MPIQITDPFLNRARKRETKEIFNRTIDEFNGELTEYKAQLINHKIINIDRSKQRVVKDLSNYLFAIYQYLELPNQTKFTRLGHKRLIAALLYFYELDDAIPDTTPFTGYLDDAHCVNLALSMQDTFVRNKIEGIVKSIEFLEEDNAGTE